jgi:uncharacterized membrane protein
MNDEKAWWQSRTIIGIVVMLLAQVLKWFKIDIVNEDLTDIVTLAMETLGAALAIYGRVKARKTLRMTKPGGKYNPNAEVRRAKPVRKKVLGLFLVLFSAHICYSEIAYPAHVWYENPIKMCEVVDERPFLIRLLDSLIVSISILPLKGEIKGEADF